ncbi:MAG TPA: hypothetical protein VJA21_32840 [Verrucomicrobiae bacterium]
MNLISDSTRSHAQRAWTLVEVSVAVCLSSVIMAALMQTSLFTSRSFVAMGNYNELDQLSRNALDTMTRDIRQAKVFSPKYYRTNMMIFTNLDNGYFGYVWDPRTKVVSRLSGGFSPASGSFVNVQSNTVLTGCEYFSFRIWQRNPTNGFQFPWSSAGNPIDTKLVDVSWRCSRRVLDKFNTESVQTAKIVLRN